MSSNNFRYRNNSRKRRNGSPREIQSQNKTERIREKSLQRPYPRNIRVQTQVSSQGATFAKHNPLSFSNLKTMYPYRGENKQQLRSRFNTTPKYIIEEIRGGSLKGSMPLSWNAMPSHSSMGKTDSFSQPQMGLKSLFDLGWFPRCVMETDEDTCPYLWIVSGHMVSGHMQPSASPYSCQKTQWGVEYLPLQMAVLTLFAVLLGW